MREPLSQVSLIEGPKSDLYLLLMLWSISLANLTLKNQTGMKHQSQKVDFIEHNESLMCQQEFQRKIGNYFRQKRKNLLSGKHIWGQTVCFIKLMVKSWWWWDQDFANANWGKLTRVDYQNSALNMPNRSLRGWEELYSSLEIEQAQLSYYHRNMCRECSKIIVRSKTYS